MDEHWQNLAAVAVTRESCIAIDAIRARVTELEAKTPSALKAKLESAEDRIKELERSGTVALRLLYQGHTTEAIERLEKSFPL